jgi:hypothetical protein
MILLTSDAKKVISLLEKNFGGSHKIIDQLKEGARPQRQSKIRVTSDNDTTISLHAESVEEYRDFKQRKVLRTY